LKDSIIEPSGSFSAEEAPFGAIAPPSAAIQSAPAGFASVIVAGFPALFTEFRGKHFTLLWRGSRNGFGTGLSRPLRRQRAHSGGGMGNSDSKADLSPRSFLFRLRRAADKLELAGAADAVSAYVPLLPETVHFRSAAFFEAIFRSQIQASGVSFLG
jgi:hypothetical protein